MGEQEGAKRRAATGRPRQRGVGFPRISLAVAADLLVEAARTYGPVMSREAFAALGARRRGAPASTRSGSYLTKLAAFKDFGLIEVSGRQIRLTDLAQRIAVPASAVSRAEALETAFHQAVVFRQLYEDTPKHEPVSVEAIADRAVWHYGVAVSARDDFTRAFVDSAATAGLARRLDRTTVQLSADPAIPTSAGQPSALPIVRPAARSGSEAGQPPGAGEARPEPASLSGRSQGQEPGADADLAPIVQQRWAGPTYDVNLEIRAARPLRAETFRQLADIVAEIERLTAEIGRAAFDSGSGAPV